MIQTKAWEFDIKRTQQRYEVLKEYYEVHKLNANSFSCKYFQECLASQKFDTIKQYSGGTAGLMPFYDVRYKEKEIRVMIIGKEGGYMVNSEYGTSPNFDIKTRNLLNCINWKRKNNHIRGTLITLQKIFEVNSEYIYASYSMSEGLRCAFQLKNRITNISSVKDTATMRKYCMTYLIDEIKILEPTLIIVQGAWAIKGKRSHFIDVLADSLGTKVKCLKKSRNQQYGLYEFPSFMCITSHHPAILAHWLKNLAPDSLWPMIDYLREIGYLPTFDEQASIEYEKTVKPRVDPIIASLPSNDFLRGKIQKESIQQTLF